MCHAGRKSRLRMRWLLLLLPLPRSPGLPGSVRSSAGRPCKGCCARGRLSCLLLQQRNLLLQPCHDGCTSGPAARQVRHAGPAALEHAHRRC